MGNFDQRIPLMRKAMTWHTIEWYQFCNVEWMKNWKKLFHIVQNRYDDFILKDHGEAFPFTIGFHLIGQLGAIAANILFPNIAQEIKRLEETNE